MKLIKKVTAVALVSAMTLTGSGFTAIAGTFSNADSIWSTQITKPLFDSTAGSLNISKLQVPTLAYDDTSIGLVWEKPEQYANVADYNVYINGVKQTDTARANFAKYADWTNTYMNAFYDYYNTKDNSKEVDMVNVDVHSYRATGLQPDTEYTFKVIALDKDGKELGTAQSVSQKTTKTPKVYNIKDFGAETSIGYTSYDDTINAFVVKNTKAIQAAIDACEPGGKVVIPEGIFVTGALWLKSNMTFEINGTLWASPNSDHFEIGFLMYPFYTDTRSWGIVNAVSSDPTKQLENIRITGNGNVYGNGWKYGNGATINPAGGLITNINSSTNPRQSGDVDTTVAGFEKYALPRYVNGGNAKVFYQGILAADSAMKYLANVSNADGTKKYTSSVISSLPSKTEAEVKVLISSDDLTDAYATRSSLVILRNIDGVYIDDIRVENPSNHTINILDSDNIAVNNVKAISYDCNNGDGIGFGCSRNVICWNNFCDTGDDTIGFGSSVGKGAQDANIQTNSTLWIFNNFLREGHGGAIAAGSHTANGITDVLAEDNVMNHSDMPFRFKSAPTTGGYISNITMRDCAIADCDQAFVLTTSYSDPNSASTTEFSDAPGSFYNFVAYNITAYTVKANTICVYADVDPVKYTQKTWHTHHNLYFQDVTFGNVGTNGSYKNYNGWETLTGCEDSVFYNVDTTSYNSAAVSKNTNKAWTNIKYSKNIQLLGTTATSTTSNISSATLTAIATTPVWGTAKATATSADDGKSVELTWDNATVSSGTVTYGVDTYVGDTKVNTVDGLTTNAYSATGLSAGVDYKFRIFASENSGANLVVNKTEGPSATIKTTGTLDQTSVVAPASSDVTLSDAYYTCAQASWTSALTNDSRVRGYKIYVNGVLKDTLYNYQIPSANRTGTISTQAGRLTPGMENVIKVVAFTDSGAEFTYNTAKITTLGNYDYKSPVFSVDSALTATKQNNGDVVLTWKSATDDTAVLGYRVYVDGTPVYASTGEYFNPVNGKYTTKDTTYTISGLDLSKDHTFTVQAGDTWWRAATTMGTYDKLAGYNWTVNGISSTLVAPISITAGTSTPVTSAQVEDQLTNLANDQAIIIDGTNGTIGELSKSVFEKAAAKNSTITIKTNNATWEFSGIAAGVASSFKSPVVTTKANVTAITNKLTTASGIDASKIMQLSFSHDGVLPSQAKVNLKLDNKYVAGTELYFYYFNESTGIFESMQKCTVKEDGSVDLTLTHCSDYILSTFELPQALTTVVTNTDNSTNGNQSNTDTNNTVVNNTTDTTTTSQTSVKTGDTAPIVPLAMVLTMSLAGIVVLAKKRKKEAQ